MNLVALAHAKALHAQTQKVSAGRKPVINLAPAVPVGTVKTPAVKPPTPKPPKPGKPRFNPWRALEATKTGQLLTPRQLNSAANALAVIETRPEIHGYREIASQLGREAKAQDKGLESLGNRTMGQVSDVYKGIAQTEAQNIARQQALAGQLNQQTSQIANNSADSLNSLKQGAVGALNQNIALRGGNGGGGSAQQELSQAVADQKEAQAADAQAAQNFALSEGATSQDLLAGLAGSEQARGGESVAQIGRDISGRRGESALKYGESQRTALNKLAEAKASLGPKRVKDLLELRGQEQKYKLGQAAVTGNTEKLGLENKKLESEAEQHAVANRIAQQKANAETTSAAASAQNAATSAWKARHPEATRKEVKKAKEYIGEVKSYLPSAVASYGAPKNPKQLNQFIGAVNKEVSAPPQIVRSVLERWFAKRSANEALKNALKPGF